MSVSTGKTGGIQPAHDQPGADQSAQEFTYPKALRSLMRQIRGHHDWRSAIPRSRMRRPAGLTGHLVISTIHSGIAAGVFAPLINMDIEPFLPGLEYHWRSAYASPQNCPHCAVYQPETRAAEDDAAGSGPGHPVRAGHLWQMRRHRLPRPDRRDQLLAPDEIFRAASCKNSPPAPCKTSPSSRACRRCGIESAGLARGKPRSKKWKGSGIAAD